VEISGRRSARAWNSEEPNDLWVGHRDRPNELLVRDPALLQAAARKFTSYPGGHAEGFSDTFKQLFRDVYDTIVAVPQMAAILDFFHRLAHETPWSAALCATALLEEEVVAIAQTVGRALVQYYGVRPEWGGMNYTVHEAIEAEESGQTLETINNDQAPQAPTGA